MTTDEHDESWELALQECNAFLDLNGFEFPTCTVKPLGGRVYGQYSRRTRCVEIDVRKCHHAMTLQNPNNEYCTRTWADFSVLGVLAHEVGHHVDYSIGARRKLGSLSHDFLMKVAGEPPIGYYSRLNAREDLAESLMLFITNPTLLKQLWPRRYDRITGPLQLVPSVTSHWRELLPEPWHMRVDKWPETL